MLIASEPVARPATANHPFPLTDRDHRIIGYTLSGTLEQGARWRDTATVFHWVSVVVGLILHLLRRIEGFKDSSLPNAKISVLDVYV